MTTSMDVGAILRSMTNPDKVIHVKPGSSIQIENVSLNPGRVGFIRTLERMGASIEVRYLTAEGKEPIGIIEAAYTPSLRGCEIPSQHIASEIDEIPVLALVAAHASGITVFRMVFSLEKSLDFCGFAASKSVT